MNDSSIEIKTVVKPTNGFEATKYVIENDKLSNSAFTVAIALCYYWNMDGKGTCNPSLENIRRLAHIKSRSTVKLALAELEASGEWIIDRSEDGKKTNNYYPQFVANPGKPRNMKNKPGLEQRKENRATILKNRKIASYSTASEALDPFALPDEATVVKASDSKASPRKTYGVKAEKCNSELEKWEGHFKKTFKKIQDTPRKVVLTESELTTYNAIETDHGMTGIPFYVMTAKDYRYNAWALVARWMNNFSSQYPMKQYTHSDIFDIYHEFAEGKLESFAIESLEQLDTAMTVLGNDGFVPSVQTLKALMYAPYPTGKMAFLRTQYETTLTARHKTTYYHDECGMFF